VLLFLHGCGEYGGAYVDIARAATEHGFAGIAPTGPVATRGGGRAWPADSFTATHEYLRETLARCEMREEIDCTRVFLSGFSQGATHAVGLLASMPEEYQGALAMSPGEGPPIPTVVNSALCPRPLYVAYGQKEYRVFRKKAQRCSALWRRAKWPCLLDSHPGWHQFPSDWDRRFPKVMQWLVSAAQAAEEGRT
jgi:predicted esterase